MTAVAVAPERPFAWLRQSVILAQRSLRKTLRNPGPIINGIVTPALFMVLFVVLFGPALAGSTGDYLRYLFPGILVMGTGLAGMVSTGTAISLEAKNGVTDRAWWPSSARWPSRRTGDAPDRPRPEGRRMTRGLR